MPLYVEPRFSSSPVGVISKTTFNTLRSSVFLAVFVAGYQTQICIHRNIMLAGWSVGNSKYLYWLFGLVCAVVSIMIEQESRRAELAMYVLPKAAESIYKILYRKNIVKGVKNWDVMMFSVAMSLIMVKKKKRHIRSYQIDESFRVYAFCLLAMNHCLNHG